MTPLIATALDPLSRAALVNNSYSTITIMPELMLACIMMPPIVIMVSYSDAHADWANADIRILSLSRKRDRNPDGRK